MTSQMKEVIRKILFLFYVMKSLGESCVPIPSLPPQGPAYGSYGRKTTNREGRTGSGKGREGEQDAEMITWER